MDQERVEDLVVRVAVVAGVVVSTEERAGDGGIALVAVALSAQVLAAVLRVGESVK